MQLWNKKVRSHYEVSVERAYTPRYWQSAKGHQIRGKERVPPNCGQFCKICLMSEFKHNWATNAERKKVAKGGQTFINIDLSFTLVNSFVYCPIVD